MRKIILIVFLLIQVLVSAQNKKVPLPISIDSLRILKNAVEANPDSIRIHQSYIKAVGINNSDLPVQYETWSKQFPRSAVVPFAIGDAYYNVESPKAKPWLLKALYINPKFAKAYFDLWIDGERWGDFVGSRKYLRKALESDPQNPDYTFYYGNTFKETDPERYKREMWALPKNFPKSERGAQALYWLGLYVTDYDEKIKVYSQLKKNYPPEKSGWSSSGMYNFFYTYLERDPAKALEVANSIIAISTTENDKKSWGDRAKVAQDLIKIKSLLAERKATAALGIAEAINPERRSPAADQIILLKSEIYDITGNTKLAYEKLVGYYALNPGDQVKEALLKYGKKLGKNNNGAFADIWKIRDSTAVQATPFSLEQYLKVGKASLSDFKGKVILLTYWFPGCGPCRGEFPYFEQVIRKFSKEKVVYLGINIESSQDEYVVPFIKSSGYSFIPLKGENDKQGNLSARGAPTNYLIDQEGRIIFKNFRTDRHNVRSLELMISEVIDKGKFR